MPAGVLVIVGPTAAGKTELAIDLARTFDAEIVGADSRQIYRGMSIGTAAPTPQQRLAAPHHFVEFLDPRERYSAGRYALEAGAAIAAIHARGKRAIVVGGTGFYVRALTGGVQLAPERNDDLRARLAREATVHDARFLHQWLSLRAPQRASRVHEGDTYRVLRALEIALAGEKNATQRSPKNESVLCNCTFLKVALAVERTELDERIERRVDQMLEGGFIEEAQRIGAQAVAASAVGYPQALAYLQGRCTREELRALLVRVTRRYARRQTTWFRSEPGVIWLPPERVEHEAREKLGWV